MAERDTLSVRIDPRILAVISQKAEDLQRSQGWVVESMACQIFAEQLAGVEPGQRIVENGSGTRKTERARK